MKKHNIHPPTQSIQSKLIKYNHPALLASIIERKEQLTPLEDPSTPPGYGGSDSSKDQCQDTGLNKRETEHLLNTILPPKDWIEGGNHWHQTVSSSPASRHDVIVLEQELNKLMKESKGRETGICPIRRDLFTQCLDELIRQITITCAQRGLLLLRIRDEYHKAFILSRSLYTSSAAYGMRKALKAELGKTALERKILEIADEQESLVKSIKELDTKMDVVDRGFNEKRDADEKRHFEEVKHLKQINNQLKQQLTSIVSSRPTPRPKPSVMKKNTIVPSKTMIKPSHHIIKKK